MVWRGRKELGVRVGDVSPQTLDIFGMFGVRSAAQPWDLVVRVAV